MHRSPSVTPRSQKSVSYYKVLKVSFCDTVMSGVRRALVRACVRKLFHSKDFSWTIWPNLIKLGRNVPWVTLFQSYWNGSGPLHIGAKKRQKGANLEQTLKIFLSKSRGPRTLIFGMNHHLNVLYKDCSNYAPRVKIGPTPGFISFRIDLYRENL